MFDPLEIQLKHLLVNAMKGDEVAYQTFLTSTQVFVKRYLAHLGGRQLGSEVLEDLRQDVMLSIHQKKHTYLAHRPLLPWIYAITRYRYIDFYRAQRRAPAMLPLEDVYLVNEDRPFVTLDDILVLLTPQQQTLLRLVKIDEVPYPEAARQLGIGLPALKVKVHRTLKSLKQKLGA